MAELNVTNTPTTSTLLSEVAEYLTERMALADDCDRGWFAQAIEATTVAAEVLEQDYEDIVETT